MDEVRRYELAEFVSGLGHLYARGCHFCYPAKGSELIRM